MSSALDLLDALVSGAPPERRAALRGWLLPELVRHTMCGVPCEPTARALLELIDLGEPEVRRAALSALASLLDGSGDGGLALLAELPLDATARARDALPELIGACRTGPAVEPSLRGALASPSPARRRHAIRGCARAYRHSGRRDLTESLLAAGSHRTDFTLLTDSLIAIGEITAGSLDAPGYAAIASRLSDRLLRASFDAGWNPLAGLARAVRDGPLAPRAVDEWLRPALASSGGSLAGARRRLAGLDAWAILHQSRAPAGLPEAWLALEDPIRAVRFAAQRAAVATVPSDAGEGLVAHLLERATEGGPSVACAALCLGALCEGHPHEAVRERMLAWLTSKPRGGHPAIHFGLARLHPGSGDAAVDGLLRRALTAREGPGERTVLALGLLHAGRCDAGVAEALRAVAKRKRPSAAKAAAWAALGLVAAGGGVSIARPIALGGGASVAGRLGALLALCGPRAGLVSDYCGACRGA